MFHRSFFAAVVFAASICKGNVLYTSTSYGSTLTFNAGSQIALIGSTSKAGIEFVLSPGTHTLTEAVIPAFEPSGLGPITFEIFTQGPAPFIAVKPTTSLGSTTATTSATGSPYDVVHGVFSSPITLQGGTTYYLVLSAGVQVTTAGGAASNSVTEQRFAGGSWQPPDTFTNWAFALLGDQTVPEPATFALAGVGLAAVAWVRSRKR